MRQAVVTAWPAASTSRAIQRATRGQGLWSVAGRLAGAAASLVIVPVASRSLSRPEFGAWIVLSTVTSVLAFTDFGITNAVVTDVAAAVATGDMARVRHVVSTAAALLTVIGAGLIALSALMLPSLGGEHLLGVPAGQSSTPIQEAALAYLMVFAISLPLTVGLRILAALHRSDLVGRINILSSALQIIVALVAALAHGGIVVFALIAGSAPVISGTLGWVLATRVCSASRPSPVHICRRTTPLLLSRGAGYLTIGVAGAIGFETDALVIARMLGTGSSAAYLVPAKVFLMIPALLTVYFTPMWPAVARAVAAGEALWLRRAFRRALRTALLGSLACALPLSLCIRGAVAVLSPTTERPGLPLILALVALTVVLSVSAPVAAFLSGLALVRVQAVSAAFMAAFNLAGSIVLVRTLGLLGPALATVVTQTLLTLVPLILVVRRRLTPSGPAVLRIACPDE